MGSAEGAGSAGGLTGLMVGPGGDKMGPLEVGCGLVGVAVKMVAAGAVRSAAWVAASWRSGRVGGDFCRRAAIGV